ncbi:MAG: DUF1343 domain-containing protein [Saprospiraceae bacterium]|nr:DUF1343 domain-containing protein [Saprospiraceae bacterium]
MYYRLSFIILMALAVLCCINPDVSKIQNAEDQPIAEVRPSPGAHQLSAYVDLLKNKSVGLVVNQTSRVGATHLVDTLLGLEIDIDKIFSPEHGFRGDADAGAHIADGADPSTGIPIVSLYGQKRKPDVDDLKGIDVLVFDIQDVGARFYTYISTMHYVMEAAAEHHVPIIVLDRPNPNGHYVDGPIREHQFKSFVGMHPVPVVYGMTIGEYAQMINGEGWLPDEDKCDLTVIACQDYGHDVLYDLPIAPSPNLPNLRSILLYPSLCFFEGTTLSIGRGTTKQFQVIGHPKLVDKAATFTPKSMFGAAKPKWKDQLCHGIDLTDKTPKSLQAMGKLQLSYLIVAYQDLAKDEPFFNEKWFDKLAGTSTLREAIVAGQSEDQIRSTWQAELAKFKLMRAKYLIYQ